jgi:hypothetical protein
MSMKNSNETIGNQPRDLPVCSAVPQPPRNCVPHQQDVPLWNKLYTVLLLIGAQALRLRTALFYCLETPSYLHVLCTLCLIRGSEPAKCVRGWLHMTTQVVKYSETNYFIFLFVHPYGTRWKFLFPVCLSQKGEALGSTRNDTWDLVSLEMLSFPGWLHETLSPAGRNTPTFWYHEIRTVPLVEEERSCGLIQNYYLQECDAVQFCKQVPILWTNQFLLSWKQRHQLPWKP